MGHATEVLYTGDSGANWTNRSQTPTILRLQMVSPTTGWLAACQGVGCDWPTLLERTTDSGRTWQTRTHLQRSDLAQTDFVSAQAGWMIQAPNSSMSGLLDRTSNGGKTWVDVDPSLPATSGGYVMDFLNLNDGWLAVVSQGATIEQMKTLYHTTNGGTSWTQVAASPSFGESGVQAALPLAGYLSVVDFVNSHVGYMYLVRNGLFRTTDGGGHWTKLPRNPYDPGGTSVKSMSFTGPDTGYVLTDSNAGQSIVWQTTDGGQRWTERYPLAQ